jgi:methylphosphotriester-DNA--protein-cysteine methyltransferase
MTIQTFTSETDKVRWNAVCERDAQFDGEFVFVVRTTGIFLQAELPFPPCETRKRSVF